MLFPFLSGSQIPTPPSILKKWPLWYFLAFLLIALTVIQMLGVQVFGAVLAVLTLVFVWLVCRKKFADAGHYVMILALLCIMNFIFDFVPFCQYASGREEVLMSPGSTVIAKDGWSTTFTRTIKISPLFDSSQGLKYNCQSLAICISPATMLLGAFLSVRAWYDIQQAMPDAEDTGYDWLLPRGDNGRGIGGGSQDYNYGTGGRPLSRGRSTGDGPGLTIPHQQPTGGRQFQHFGGQGHRLGND